MPRANWLRIAQAQDDYREDPCAKTAQVLVEVHQEDEEKWKVFTLPKKEDE